jgi:hypothetical protein
MYLSMGERLEGLGILFVYGYDGSAPGSIIKGNFKKEKKIDVKVSTMYVIRFRFTKK